MKFFPSFHSPVFFPSRIPLAFAAVLLAILPPAAIAEPGDPSDEVSRLRELLAQVAREPVPGELPEESANGWERPRMPIENVAEGVEKHEVGKVVQTEAWRAEVDAVWPKLVEALDSELYPVSSSAARVMALFPDRLVPMVPALLQEPGASTRMPKIMGPTGHTKARLLNGAVPSAGPRALLPYLDSPGEDQRLYAAWAVAVVPPSGRDDSDPATERRVLRKLRSLLGDPSGAVRAQAARSLGRLGTAAMVAEAELVELATAPDPPCSPWLDALEEKCAAPRPAPSGGDVLPLLRFNEIGALVPERIYRHLATGPQVPYLSGPREVYPRSLALRDVVRQAVFALASIGSVESLVGLMGHERAETRLDAIQALRTVEGDRPGTEPVLVGLVGDPHPLLRQAALRALEERPPSTDALDTILEATRDEEKNPEVAIAAIQTLGRMAPSDVSGRVSAACEKRLVPLLGHGNHGLVGASLEALGAALPGERFMTIVKAELLGDPSPIHADSLLITLLHRVANGEDLNEETLAASISLILSAMDADRASHGAIRDDILIELRRWILWEAEDAEGWKRQAPRLVPALRRELSGETPSLALILLIRKLGPHAAPLRADLEALLKAGPRDLSGQIERILQALDGELE